MSKKRVNELKKGISDRIRAILKEKDWFQQQLADGIGTNKANISNILHGKVNLTIETIVAIEEVLDQPILEIVTKQKKK